MGQKLTLRQAAERAGLSRQALQEAVLNNKINPLKAEWVETAIGGYWVVDEDELARYLDARWGGRKRRPGGGRRRVEDAQEPVD